MTFAEKAISFYNQLSAGNELPHSVKTLNPYEQTDVKQIVVQFYEKFYADELPRVWIMGINPGRLGGGTTGISFTDPVNLQQYCHINHTFKNTTELSSQFIYKCINKFGGTDRFFSRFHLGAVYPLALVKEGKNYNYYDSPEVYKALESSILEYLKQQVALASAKEVICLGQKNYQYLQLLNKQLDLFDKIHVLEHPRFIMQYKRKEMTEYIKKYVTLWENLYTG
ncbi:uracil-DNA glycosylase family protein [Xanthocytophaga flava]|uniref:uracil-DNA glycosylase family protein n=1 Tax=Xanthocytophaga flava TaxID=3048013 RepID=UPI0028D1B228|nr:uracil-DNA glycosylase family protein [Xanthocytophaga flavus]MDJ1473739.1 DUF4918 family protein [Xanthocytophaga flavus]